MWTADSRCKASSTASKRSWLSWMSAGNIPRTGAGASHCMQRNSSSPDRAAWSIERGEDAIAGALDQSAAMGLHVVSGCGVVGIEQAEPAAVADAGRGHRRVDDVGEQDRGEHAVGIGRMVRSCQELLDLRKHRVGVPEPQHVIAGLLEVARPGEVISEVAALTLRRDAVTLALDDERRTPIAASTLRTSIARIMRNIRCKALGVTANRSQ